MKLLKHDPTVETCISYSLMLIKQSSIVSRKDWYFVK